MRLTVQSFGNLPIQRKISLGILLTCCTALSVAAAAIFFAQLRTFRQSFTRDLEAIGQMLGHNTTAALTFSDATSAKEVLAAVRAKPYILQASLQLPDGSEFASFRSPGFSTLPAVAGADGFHSAGGFLALNQPVMLAGERIATLRLLSDYHTEYLRSLRLYLTIMAAALLLSILLALVLAGWLERLIATPILNLAATARNVAEQKNYSVRAPKLSNDEVGHLTDAFNQMLAKIEQDDSALRQANQALEREIEERKRRELEIESLHKELMSASRQAGMAEVATGVLHNVGNVLNSVNVSANVISETLNQPTWASLAKLASLVKQHPADLGEFLTSDPKGKRVPQFICALSAAAQEERVVLMTELNALLAKVEHIKEIVAMQQTYATVVGVMEDLAPAELMDAALRMNSASFAKRGVEIRKDFQPVPPARVDKHKVLQILINLLCNARDALDQGGKAQKTLCLGVRMDAGRILVSVSDNGIGIPPENLTRIFGHGFTTKRDGHGFGLHSGALAAKEMGGSLLAHSEGPNKGATFTLELPPVPAN